MIGVSPRTPNPPRVLIVDDQPSFRGMARRVLEWRGYVVAGEAGCANSAIAAAERLAPDAVLLDVCLGEASGFDVACALTEAHPGLRGAARLEHRLSQLPRPPAHLRLLRVRAQVRPRLRRPRGLLAGVRRVKGAHPASAMMPLAVR